MAGLVDVGATGSARGERHQDQGAETWIQPVASQAETFPGADYTTTVEAVKHEFGHVGPFGSIWNDKVPSSGAFHGVSVCACSFQRPVHAGFHSGHRASHPGSG